MAPLLGARAGAQLGPVPVPAGNPITPEKTLLGMALFFEEQLSSDGTVACATCHLPEAGGSDPRDARAPGLDGLLGTLDDEFGSPGLVRQDAAGRFHPEGVFGLDRQVTARHAPTVLGAAYFRALFWDGRAGPEFTDLDGNVVLADGAALESQAVVPIVSPVEMAREGRTWSEVTERLARAVPLVLARDLPARLADFVRGAGYPELFARAFGDAAITRERIAMALATYERTLVPDHTPFDLGTLSDEELQGLQVFRAAQCDGCHPVDGGLFSDGDFHDIQLPGHPRRVKTPTLRNAALQPRHMSSGQHRTLDEVVTHYVKVGLAPPLTPEETRVLLAFLEHGLTDPRVAAREEPFDRPTLLGERAPFGANQFGSAAAGSGGRVPRLLAHAPPFLGNRDFALGIGDALGGAPAFLLVGLERTRGGTNLAGVPLHVVPGGALRLGLALAGQGPGAGFGTRALAVPAAPALIGRRAYVQGFVLDPGAAAGVAATRGAFLDLLGL